VKFNDLDESTVRIQELSDSLESCTTAPQFRQIHSKFSGEILGANLFIKTIKSQIDALEVSNTDFQTKHAEGGRESDLEFRRVAWAGFANKLRTSLLNFNKSQSRFDRVYEQRTGVNGFNPDLTLHLNGPSESSTTTTAVQRAFATATAVSEESDIIKKEDMKRIEKSMREIREAFIQIAALVDSQGEMLDCIEFSVVNAKNYGHRAQIQLIEARKKQRERGWIKFACYFFLFLCLGGLIFGIINLARG